MTTRTVEQQRNKYCRGSRTWGSRSTTKSRPRSPNLTQITMAKWPTKTLYKVNCWQKVFSNSTHTHGSINLNVTMFNIGCKRFFCVLGKCGFFEHQGRKNADIAWEQCHFRNIFTIFIFFIYMYIYFYLLLFLMAFHEYY